MILAIDAGFPALSCIRLSTDYSEVDNENLSRKDKNKTISNASAQHSKYHHVIAVYQLCLIYIAEN